ncbi:4-hydroxy-tetrahydrodipicolinate reductase [Candidatus Woesearchaeota archaeon]|nr:4-hydroxy-tetrahydrodipicolinate reductase [Candidatus Woesearchaeota archaeon]
MNIAIIGYGKMGHEIEKAAKAKGISVKTIDPNEDSADYREINEESMKGIDVCVDFTHPDSVISNIEKISKFGKNIVVGTTGWYDKIGEVKKIIEDAKTGLIWSGNFSIGVNICFKIIENTAKIMDKFPDYDAFVHEFHHNKKADSPSGTAVMIGKILTANMERKKKIVTEELKRKIEPDELHISSTRSGSIPGTHIVGFDSPADTIEITHTARGRQGFAVGAVMAAEWIKGKKGFFDINAMMKNIIGGA